MAALLAALVPVASAPSYTYRGETASAVMRGQCAMPGQVEMASSYCCSADQDRLLLTKQDCQDACNADDDCVAFSWREEQISWSYIFTDCDLYDATALSAVDDVVGSQALSPPQGNADTSCYVKLPYSTAALSCAEDTVGSPATPPPSPAPLAPLATPVPDADSLNADSPTAVLRLRIDGATYRPGLLNIGDIGIFRDINQDGCTNKIEPSLIVDCFSSTPYEDHEMCDMAHDGDGATEGSFTSDEEGMIYVVLQMAVWVMDEVRCVELQTAVQHEYGGASSIFILEVKFPGDDDWSVVAMKSLTADYADGTVNSSYTFAPGLRQLDRKSVV